MGWWGGWWGRLGGSNPLPPRCERDALPAAPQPRTRRTTRVETVAAGPLTAGIAGDGSVDGRAAGLGIPVPEVEDPGIGLEPEARVVVQRRVLDHQGAGAVVADEEDRTAALAGHVVLDRRPHQPEREQVAVEVDRSAAAPARRARAGGVGAATDGLVVAEHAVGHGPRDADARQTGAVGAAATGEGAVGDRHRLVVEMGEQPDPRPAEGGPGLVTAVVREPAVHHREPAAAHEHRTATAAVHELTGGAAVGEGEVAKHELGRGLVVAVRGGPGQPLLAGVLVEDPALPGATQRHLAAAVDDHLGRGVVHLRLPVHDDRDRVGAAVEGDDPALGHGPTERLRGAAGGGAVTDDPV